MKKTHLIIGLCMISFLAASAPAMLRDDITVNRDGVVMRKAKRSMSPVVAELTKGQKVAIVTREDGWIQGDANGLRGWIAEADLKNQKGLASGARGVEAAVGGDAQAMAARDAASGKGVGPTALKVAATKGYDPAKLDRLIDLRNRLVNGGEWEKFAREGKVGPSDLR